ncbi:hypothetical protein K491DRAFT_598093 [Lophiostoma macrostomum CBS 122681]|uniref:AB hydrolase-1 domain-containing protein n=1 Tax=Lophiostoma macrostomum CBS 122681 TaxID=1314788 RepID=A0A6A6T8A4_9PLEO|nr:hypothetical protein K491DRAFT_598093 [Lophiostoma macrostomum CBS 122681]
MGALEFLCDVRFHHSFLLPPDPRTGRRKPFRVSYSDFGDSDSDAVVVFCGALMDTRLSYAPLDQLAKVYHVRMIHADRPGIGGTDPVEQHQRIATWLEIVPALLAHLKISHVSLASHSGGDIYLFNTLLTFPHLLHPTTPYVTFFAPWVHHSHTGVTQMRATELLPAPLIGRFAALARFVNNNVIPLADLSSAFLHRLKDSFRHSTSAPAPVSLSPKPMSRASSTKGVAPGLDLDDPAVVDEMRQLITTYLFAENTDGISADAQLFLKKPHSTPWHSGIFWSDIDHVVPLLRKIILEDQDRKEDGRRWLVDAYHAETDSMVGARGRVWFDNCWSSGSSDAQSPAVGEERSRNSLEYRSETVPYTDHNYIMDPGFGCSERWLERVREAFPQNEEV